MRVPYYHVDAFTKQVFSGNPAGVCLLTDWLPDAKMQKIASENKHSETAFVVPKAGAFAIRWFSPKVEVDLCGHATLAAAHVLYSEKKAEGVISLQSKSGPLTVEPRDEYLFLNFPAMVVHPCPMPAELAEGLGRVPKETYRGRSLIAIFENEKDVKSLRPNIAALEKIDTFAVIATAPGREYDYVLRCFAPQAGIPEDPVTGSAQCELAPFWSARLDKSSFFVRQLSARGGHLAAEVHGKRVMIGGQAVQYLKGEINV